MTHQSGLYIHIPFCHAKCYYCDFYSMPRRIDAHAYIDALLAELAQRRHEVAQPFTTIYIGGGTPSSLPLAELRRLLTSLPREGVEEFTVEVNPDDVTPELCHLLTACGTNRVSMGVQSLIDTELQAVGRRHTARQAIDAVSTLRAAGITNLSLDLIYGLPGQTTQSWQQSLAALMALHPEHLSAYALSLEPGTRLYAMHTAGKVALPHTRQVAEMYHHLCREAHAAGYEHYEIANFAKPGLHSRHNAAYWTFAPYLGIGPGAHSFDGSTRRFNPSSLKEYLACPTQFTQTEESTPTERLNEYIMVALRTARGLDMQEVAKLFGAHEAERCKAIAQPLINQGIMEQHHTALRIAQQHWLTSDATIIRFFKD